LKKHLHFTSGRYGELVVEFSRINELFLSFETDLKEAFSLDEENFISLKKFKLCRGGWFVVIRSEQKVLAFFTFSKINETFYELGDLVKQTKMFSRSDFAKGLKMASETLLDNGKFIIGYPNSDAVKLEIEAGYEVKKNYVRHISYVFFQLTIRLPIEIFSGEWRFDFSVWKKYKVLSFFRKYRKTALKVFRFNVLSKSIPELPFSTFNCTGLLYEFIEVKGYGDPVIFFKGESGLDSDIPLGFEHSDNSA